MDGNLILCTDDHYIANMVPQLFRDPGAVWVLRKSDLPIGPHVMFHYHHFILGVETVEEADWRLCESIIESGFHSVYIMVRNYPSPDERKRAEDIGIKDVLLDPLMKIRDLAENSTALFSLLQAPTRVSETGEEAESEQGLIYLGRDTYFHPREFWAGYGQEKIELSEREAALLELFVQNEGIVIRTEVIAEEIWNGQIEKNSVRKSIRRLRGKLGPAKELFKGRKQGGYIFKREGD
ncbi:MAG TPA: winged helix-turn-helix domain-containing protein [Bacillales bacterium]|nr:winged helix-turn-helix domain-containing protein [Bacillales bacterium]